jgi:hypothetical protein
MKPTVTAKIEYQLARHDPRAGSGDAFPVTDHFFRPEGEASPGPVRYRRGHRARRAFCEMIAEMLIKHERDEPIELFLFAFVTAIAAWPLVDLLIVLARR